MRLKRNIQVRNGRRTFVTKTIEAVHALLTDFDPSKCQTPKKTLDEKKATLNNLDILEEISPKKIGGEINETSEFGPYVRYWTICTFQWINS